MSYNWHVSKTEAASSSGSGTVPATARDTREYLILRAGRPFAPVPNVFVQTPGKNGSKPGPLAQFVRNGDKRGLLAFLLLHTIISSGDHGDGWSSTLGDGTNTPYTRPQGKSPEDRFLRLTTEFWNGDWDQNLTLPAIAMLLVALKEKPEFTLPTEHMPAWYGWSADTAERGFKDLRDAGLLDVVQEQFANPLSPTGLSTRNIYRLQPPFDRDSITDAKAAHALTRKKATRGRRRAKKRP